MNSCVIFGYLGQDAEFKETKSGTWMLKFSVANTTGFGDKKQTNWFNCVAFGERWEKLSGFLRKGTAVVVEGEVTLNTYENKDGETKSSLQVYVNKVSLGGKGEPNSKPATQEAQGKMEFDNDDIPW